MTIQIRTAPTAAESDCATVFVAIELSRSSWVVAVQGVSSEPVSGGWAPNSLLNREKTGNFSEFGQYGGIFGRINSSNQ